jgi:hypothetical protein
VGPTAGLGDDFAARSLGGGLRCGGALLQRKTCLLLRSFGHRGVDTPVVRVKVIVTLAYADREVDGRDDRRAAAPSREPSPTDIFTATRRGDDAERQPIDPAELLA